MGLCNLFELFRPGHLVYLGYMSGGAYSLQL
jgi:hypothetical protein